MSEVVQDTQQEFWRPPSPLVSNDLLARDLLAKEIILRETVPAMAEACRRCGSEFLLGSGFCHSCGRRRPEAGGPITKADAALSEPTLGAHYRTSRFVGCGVFPQRNSLPFLAALSSLPRD